MKFFDLSMPTIKAELIGVALFLSQQMLRVSAETINGAATNSGQSLMLQRHETDDLGLVLVVGIVNFAAVGALITLTVHELQRAR